MGSISESRLILIYNNPEKSWVDNAIQEAKSSYHIPFACLRALTNLEYAKAAFVEAGIDASRVTIRGRSPTNEMHLQLYQQIDIALDPFPYNGTTTTMESLWMGVPVIAKAGEVHAGRVSASILNGIGHSELVAYDNEDYIAIAKRLSSDKSKLATLRSYLRYEMSKSPLMNARSFTDHLEQCFRNLWRKWCNKQEDNDNS